MKIIILLFVVLFVSSCEKSNNEQFDLAKAKKEYEVVHIILPTFKDVDKEYIRIYNLDNNEDKIDFEIGERWGFTYFKNEVCYIVMAEPSQYKSLKELERTLGHEHLHCIWGSWHR